MKKSIKIVREEKNIKINKIIQIPTQKAIDSPKLLLIMLLFIFLFEDVGFVKPQLICGIFCCFPLFCKLLLILEELFSTTLAVAKVAAGATFSCWPFVLIV